MPIKMATSSAFSPHPQALRGPTGPGLTGQIRSIPVPQRGNDSASRSGHELRLHRRRARERWPLLPINFRKRHVVLFLFCHFLLGGFLLGRPLCSFLLSCFLLHCHVTPSFGKGLKRDNGRQQCSTVCSSGVVSATFSSVKGAVAMVSFLPWLFPCNNHIL